MAPALSSRSTASPAPTTSGIEGISLTVAKIEGTEVTVAIIPHTVEMTNLASLKSGDPINLEVDMIAKYVEKMMAGDSSNSPLSLERLVKQGF